MYSTKNYMENGGDIWTVSGDLNISGGKVLSNGTQAVAIADHADPSTATTQDIATKQNQILAVLRSLGMIAE